MLMQETEYYLHINKKLTLLLHSPTNFFIKMEVIMRKYDYSLVENLSTEKYTKIIDGVEIIYKPVPDDDRENVLDPRVLEIAKRKAQVLFSKGRVKEYSLSKERYRPDKVSYDITTTKINCKEQLVEIDNHYIDTYIYQSEDQKSNVPILIYLHGGGFTAGDMKLFVNQMKFIAEQSGATVIFPEYRLAPECPFPAAIEDAAGIVRWAYNNAESLNGDKNKIAVAGDSAGGNLTNCCIIKDTNKIIKLGIELYPACDSDQIGNGEYEWSYDMYPVIEEHKEFAYSRIDRIKNGGQLLKKLYVHNKTSMKDPLVSANYLDDFSIFPKMIIMSSEYDFLRVSSDIFVKKCKEANVDITSIHYQGCDHGFLDLIGIEPQAEDACLEIAKALRQL